MSRRMISPQTIIKSQIVDDKFTVDLYEILEKYGTIHDGQKTITLQIYNKMASEEGLINLADDSGFIGNVVSNGTITITKAPWALYIQGMILDSNNDFIEFLEISEEDYESGIILGGPKEFDIHVIKV